MWYLYFIDNKINDKLYVGKTNNLKRRENKHRTNSENQPLKNAIEKYGVDNFNFHPFECYQSEDECYEAEKYWINYLHSQNINLYNIAEGGKGIFSGSNHYLFGKHHTEKSKSKMSKSHLGKKLSKITKLKISTSLVGHIQSKETKAKISKSKSGKNLSTNHKMKISKTSMGRKHSTQTKLLIAEYSRGENNPSCVLSDKNVFDILALWFSINIETRNQYGYKAQFFRSYIENNFNIKAITLYEYLKGKKRKDIFKLFHF